MRGIVIAVGSVLGLGGLGALAGYMLRPRAGGASGVSPEKLIGMLLVLADGAAPEDERRQARLQGEAIAKALGLPLTAKAIKADTPLPSGETWPGTNQSVRAFINAKVAAARGGG